MSQFLDSIKDVKANWKPYEKWEQEQNDKVAQKKYLSQNLEIPNDKVEITKRKAEVILRATEILDAKSEDNCQNMEMATGVMGGIAGAVIYGACEGISHLLKFDKKSLAGNAKRQALLIGPTIIASIGVILWGNSKQKEASRIGRFQAKNNELKDVKNFVVYNPEQIEAAKILAKNIPAKKDKEGIINAFNEMKQMSVDKKAYKKWLEEKIKNPDDIKKLLNVNFTSEQLKQGDEDRELIVNIVKDINIKAEEYSENLESSVDTASMLSFLISAPLGAGIFKLINKFSKNPSVYTKIFAPLAPLAVSLMIMGQGLQEKKDASRIGRFKERKKILGNPKMYMNYTEEDYKKAQSIKNTDKKKGFIADTINDLTFLPTYIKDKMAYSKYKKEEFKNNEKLHEALLQSEVSQEQLKEAKHIKDSTILAFDKVDEMSQRYSEDMEAATEITKTVVNNAMSIGTTVIGLGTAFLAYRGKLPVHKLINQASKIALDSKSSLRILVDKAEKIISKDKDLKQNFAKAIFDKNSRNKVMQNAELKETLEEMKQINVFDFESHLKKGPIAKWIKNIAFEVANFSTRNIMKTEENKLSYKNYKTIANTLLIGTAPALTALIAVPYAFNNWLTNLQKKAGKIGIMKAMQEVDHPQLYVKKEA